MRSLVLTFMVAAAAVAQSPPRLAFEVASIRPSTAPGQDRATTAGVHIDGAQVRYVFLSLKDYIGTAYKTRFAQIVAPDWIASERFDIVATLPAGATPAQVPDMLQSLLAERFGLKVHREKKEFPVYALVVGKTPLTLKEAPPETDADQTTSVAGTGSEGGVSVNLGHGSSYTFGGNHFAATKLTMLQFTLNLERFADRPIVDMTELKGRYDFAFDVTREDYLAMMIRAAIASGAAIPAAAQQLLDASSPAALGDALQQVGLRLDARKAPLDALVVDEVQKTPTAN
jgi:uncharacterized protein (TIGR03435 family)